MEDKRPQGKRYREMAPLSAVVAGSRTAEKIFGSDGFRFFLFQKRWKDIVGDVMAQESYISGYRGETLFVSVTNSAFLTHLFMMKAEILAKLAQDEFGARFSDIRFQAGAPKRTHPAASSLTPVNEARAREQSRYSESLTDGEADWISQWTGKHVKNETLRPAFADMMGEVLKIRKGELKDGYTPCPLCGALKPPTETLCPACARRLRHAKKARVVVLLRQQPHLTFQEVRALTPCDYSLYEQARDFLIHRAKDDVYRGWDREEQKRFIAALLLHKPVADIPAEEADKLLSALPEKMRNE